MMNKYEKTLSPTDNTHFWFIDESDEHYELKYNYEDEILEFGTRFLKNDESKEITKILLTNLNT